MHKYLNLKSLCWYGLQDVYFFDGECSISIHLQDRIMKHKYRNLADVEDDMMLLCQNACKFNKESSQIYTESLELENA